MNKHYNEISIEPEDDGFVTHETDISPSEVEHIGNLERISAKKAKPAGHCQFPKCEGCNDYVSYKGQNYCTVPMVISKQTWLLTEDIITKMQKQIDFLMEEVQEERHYIGILMTKAHFKGDEL